MIVTLDNKNCNECGIKLPTPKGRKNLSGLCNKHLVAKCSKESLIRRKKENPDKFRASQREYQKKYYSNNRYKKALYRAEFRGIYFDLSEDFYLNEIKKNCHYCGGSPVIFGVGLDRIDSNVGYVAGNVVSCCKNCNTMKGDFLTYEEMKAAILAVMCVRASKAGAA